VRDPDAVCIERLEHFLREENGREVHDHRVAILLAGVRPDTLKVLNNIGFRDWFPEEQVFPEEDEEYSATLRAVRFAQNRLGADEPGAISVETHGARNSDPLYYLV
jgi:SulP family sulfate permease